MSYKTSQPIVIHPYLINEFKGLIDIDELEDDKLIEMFKEYLKGKGAPGAQLINLSDIFILKSLGVI